MITPGSITSSLEQLFKMGVVINTVVDVGAADGHFGLAHYPLFPGALLVNIDANRIYEPSLKSIAEVMGGHYVIAAVSDTPGNVEITTSAHPYWNSMRGEGDAYWELINDLRTGKETVTALTLDSLANTFPLRAPYLLKLDIQGAEELALRGGARFLRDTDVVICEADARDFDTLHRLISDAGFDLFDIADLHRLQDNRLGWFYPIYLSRRHNGLRTTQVWDPAENDRVIQAQVERRKQVLEANEAYLARYRAQRAKT
ncbi:MAG: FkbM family methyltransferase [Rhodospirillaceae bacterium]